MLRFTVLTDRARSEEYAEPQQRALVDGMIARATGSAVDNAGLSRTLFELLIPNRLKDAARDERGLVLTLDKAAAAYPWELMRAAPDKSQPPLATEVGLVRQLATASFRPHIRSTREKTALVVSDPKSGFSPLPAARAEAESVRGCMVRAGYDVRLVQEGEALDILVNLFDGSFRVMHFAGHGVVDHQVAGQGQPERVSGMVIGPASFLTSAEVTKLRVVPELVFINCCHLGNMRADAATTWQGRPALAAGLATAFIEMGAKAVVAAGWAVDDEAARTFAETFYEQMLTKGVSFGEALRAARKAARDEHLAHNTWGAYQAYGDPEFRFEDFESGTAEETAVFADAEAAAKAEWIAARAVIERGSAGRKQLLESLGRIDRGLAADVRASAAVDAALGRAYAELGETELAIACYEAAIARADARVELRDVEQLGNLQVRHGTKLARPGNNSASRDRGKQLMMQGFATLERIAAFAPTSERLSLLGSAWKRRATLLQESEGKGEEIDEALTQMAEYYRRANDLARTTGGEDDYYPMLNWLDGVFLLEARGCDCGFAGVSRELEDHLARARRNAERRMRDEPDFFHAAAQAQCALTAALYATTKDGEAAGSIVSEQVQADILRGYGAQIERFGTAREWDSVVSHIKSLLVLIPRSQPDRSRADVARVRSGLEALLQKLPDRYGDPNAR